MLKGGAADDDDLSEESVRAALQHAAASRNMRHPTAAMPRPPWQHLTCCRRRPMSHVGHCTGGAGAGGSGRVLEGSGG